MLDLVIRNVRLDGTPIDIGIVDRKIVALASGMAPGAMEVPGGGLQVLPGLHDHHIHLSAWAAALASVDCSSGLDALGEATPDRSGWIRGVGVRDAPSREALDLIRDDVPVRVQHRSGAAWSLNSVALSIVAPALPDGPDVERDPGGRRTGRLFRLDGTLREYFSNDPPDLSAVVHRLHRNGITGVTDATPDLSEPGAARLEGTVGLNVTLLGTHTGVSKLLLHDHALPTFDELCSRISSLHRQGRPVAVHCVTRASLLLTLAALERVGPLPGDRLEHASVVPDGTEAVIADLGLAVVTQPSFLRLRGDDYLREVNPLDVPVLYPYRRLLDAGVKVAASSDAPYGDPDPWATIEDAAARTSRSGIIIGPSEVVDRETALRGYLSSPDDPGGRSRAIGLGQPADLCLLDTDNRAHYVVVSGTLHAVSPAGVHPLSG